MQDNNQDVEMELYGQIHHDNAKTMIPGTKSNINSANKEQNSRKKPLVKVQKRKSSQLYNLNPFTKQLALSSNNKPIPIPIVKPKPLTPYTSYLSQINSKAIDTKTKIKSKMKQDISVGSSKKSSSDDDDVTFVPNQPPLVYTIDSSDDECTNRNERINEDNRNHQEVHSMRDDSTNSDNLIVNNDQSIVMEISEICSNTSDNHNNSRHLDTQLDTDCNDVEITKQMSTSSNDSDVDDDNDVSFPSQFPQFRIPSLIRGAGINSVTKQFKRKSMYNEDSGTDDSDDSDNDDIVNDNCDKISLNIEAIENVEIENSQSIVSEASNDIETQNFVENDQSIVNNDHDVSSMHEEISSIHPEMCWNKEMTAFYNENWGDINCEELLLQQMPKSPDNWKICSTDCCRLPSLIKHFDKCLNCKEIGHKTRDCSQPKRPEFCHMCGCEGHSWKSCPLAICLKCGKGVKYFQEKRSTHNCNHLKLACFLCKQRGHLQRNCPDLWRCYHNSTNKIRKLLPVAVTKIIKSCYNCGQLGHLGETCHIPRENSHQSPKITINNFHQFSTTVQSYHMPLDLKPIDNSHTTPYSFYQNPDSNVTFRWNVNESSDRFYGRFMTSAKIQRDRSDNNHSKILENSQGNLVINPMNVKNLRTSKKPKNQILNQETVTQTTESTSLLQVKTIVDENVCPLYEIDSNVDCEDDRKNDDEDILREAIEVDKLRAPNTLINNDVQQQTFECIDDRQHDLSFIEKSKTEYENLHRDEMFLSELKKKLENAFSDDINTNGTVNDNIDSNLSMSHHNQLSSTLNESTETDESLVEKTIEKIELTKSQFKVLLNENGVDFISKSSALHQVQVSIQWENNTNSLIITGYDSQIKEFHSNLITYLENSTNLKQTDSLENVPKNKEDAIRLIRENLSLLEHPVANVDDLYTCIRTSELKAKEARKLLNVTLFGRGGLHNGHEHIIGLIEILKHLTEYPDNYMSNETHLKFCQHYQHLFSSHERNNYPQLISEYYDLIESNELPFVDSLLYELKDWDKERLCQMSTLTQSFSEEL